jgi:hypothetical protein
VIPLLDASEGHTPLHGGTTYWMEVFLNVKSPLDALNNNVGFDKVALSSVFR